MNNEQNLKWYLLLDSKKKADTRSATVDDPNVRSLNKMWRDEDVDLLLHSRCEPNPPTFAFIATQLNMLNKRDGIELDREFTTRDCINKWTSMFPTSEDANRTVEYLRLLQKFWPGLYFFTEKAEEKSAGSPPKLTSIYIVWPWSNDIMRTLAPSIFCDATFDVTIFNYKIVLITTLDGNKQHRPLMCCFILRSVASQWAIIFNTFVTISSLDGGRLSTVGKKPAVRSLKPIV